MVPGVPAGRCLSRWLWHCIMSSCLDFTFKTMPIAVYASLQGEQNGANPGCYQNRTGYACLLPALDDSWRYAFRKGSATDPAFPLGVSKRNIS
jgi:hypothetical protein